MNNFTDHLPHCVDITNAIEINRRTTIMIGILVPIPLGAIGHGRSLWPHIHNLQQAGRIATCVHDQVTFIVATAQHPQKFHGWSFLR